MKKWRIIALILLLNHPLKGLIAKEYLEKECASHSVPKRVITGVLFLPSVLFSLTNNLDSIIIFPPDVIDLYERSILKKYYPNLMQNKKEYSLFKGAFSFSRTFDISLEISIKEKADCVFIWSYLTSKIEQLKAAKIPVEIFRYEDSFNTERGLEAGFQWIDRIAKIYKQEERAKVIIGWQKQWKKSLEEKLKLSGITYRKKIIYLYRHQDYRVATEYSYQQRYFDLLKLENSILKAQENLKKESHVSIQKESFIRMDPDYIFLNQMEGVSPEDFYKNKDWQYLKAVKEKQVYKTPMAGYQWASPSQESHLMWIWMAKIIYSDLFKEVQFRSLIKETMLYLYNIKMEEEDMDGILEMEANKKSKNYKNLFSKD